MSVRVLGPDNRGKGTAFAAGLEWAIDQGAGIINLSLSSRSDAMFGVFHDLADRAYFAGVLLVCAANNIAVASYPSLFAAVVSVAAHDVRDPGVWFYNPQPPVEFGAYGLDVDVAWKGGGRIVATGNSFAAPHIAGYAARIRATHPGASPFEVKTILAATADAATEPIDGPPDALTAPRPGGQRNAPSAGRRGVDMAKDRGVPTGCDPRRRSRR